MSEKVKIAIDLMGGENSPNKNLEGVNLFIKRNQGIKDYTFYFFGDENIIKKNIKKYSYLKNNYKIFDTKIIVSDELSAMSALKKGKDSSMWKSIQAQLDLDADISLSAGNTGVR